LGNAIARPPCLERSGILLTTAAIFVVDTITHYEVAVAVFYAVVILAAVRVLTKRALIALMVICIALTVLSFYLTISGSHRAGLINSTISIIAILMTTYLVLKIEATRAAAHAAQTQLLRVARIKNLGGLAASIAHEINQPLAAIVTSGNACQRWLGQEPANLAKARQAIDRMLDDAGRASSIIARVRSLSRGESPQRHEFDFNEAVLEVIELSRGEMERNGISLQISLGDKLPAAWANRVQIQQVVGNLVLNAIEAMESIAIHRRTVRIESQSRQPHWILFTIADSGAGFRAGVFEHLFDTFWTTKEDGMGLGLSISRTIIEANDGQIWAERNADGGATFRFSVPRLTT
jgi:C4-dicarboxylate-specific signal transduction histidine kinase